MLASQLPEDVAEAKLVVEAVRELLETFMVDAPASPIERASNVLPFSAG